MGVPGALVARAISDQLNISSLGALKGTLDLKTPAARATLRGVQHLEAQHGDDIFEALWRDDAPLDALQSLQITPDGVTNTADLSPILRRATQLQALALHGVSPSAREVKGIPWSRLTALSLRGSAMERLDLSEQGAPALALLDASDTALRGVLDLTLSAPNLRALWGCGVKQLASEADHLPHAELRLLDLSFSDMTEGAARALFHPESFPCLRALNMEHLYQSALAPGEVAAWCGARPLMQVNLYKFAGDGEALGGALRRSARTLQIITLGNGTSCVGGVDAIEAEPFQALTHLQIDHALHPSELHRLLTALCATPLRHLSIALQADAALDVLLDAPLLRQLHSLSVGGAMTERRDLGADLILALLRDAGASPLLSLGWGYEVDL